MGRKLGQHFLKNPEKIGLIIAALEIQPGETIIEIGSGRGALTQPLLTAIESQKGAVLIAIEKDQILAAALKKQIGDNPKFSLITGDIRKELLSLTQNSIRRPADEIQNYKVVGNIPYYLTGYLLRQLGELEHKPQKIVLTVQKEVAERIAAKPPRMNLLAASIQFWAEPEIIGFIQKKDFQPAPQVDSAIIMLLPKMEKPATEREIFYKTVKKIFAQPRKTVKNAVRNGWPSADDSIFPQIGKIGVKIGDRPQNIDLGQLKKMAEMLYNYE